MIKLKEEKKSTLEDDMYEARVEEALAKWETKTPIEAENNNDNSPKRNKDDDEEK